MSYLHLASNANSSSSPTPPSYLHVSSGAGMSTVPSGLASNPSSLFGSLNSGKQWTNIGQSSSTSSTSNTANSLAQQLLMKQQNFLNNNGTNSLNSSSSSSHFESILGLTVGSSSQGQLEKNFELQQEDFPPLPHRSNSQDPTTSTSTSNVPPMYQSQYSSSSSSNHHSSMSNGYNSSQTSTSQQQQQQQHSQSQSPLSFKSPIDLISRNSGGAVNPKTSSLTSNSPGTTLTNPSATNSTINSNGLPSSTITDQYGLVGLLQSIQQAEKNPETSSILNCDLTTLGLSMESPNDLHPSFVSPFSDSQARPYEIDYQVPIEYQMGMQIRDKLPQVNFNTLNEDTLFFLFYLFGNDHVQLLSASELYRRDWRYHKDERLWLTRIKNIMPDQKYETYETGVYCVFDVQLWRKTHKSMRIDYEKLDANPVLKQQQQQQQQDLLNSKLFQQQSSIQQQQQQQQSYGPISSYASNPSR